MNKLEASSLYDRHRDRNLLGEEKRYLNIGYWANQPHTLDQANEDLIRLAAIASNLDGSLEVLDVGCGFGEQDFLLCQLNPELRVKGLNCCRFQVEWARMEILRRHFSPSLEFHLGRGEEIPFTNTNFDRVISIEAAFHFNTRAKFLKEALRVLKPGGRITLIDFCLSDKKLKALQRLQLQIGCRFWKIPSENLVTRSQYQYLLEEIGFVSVSVRSIWEDTYPPFVRKARLRIEDDDIRARMNNGFRWFLKTSFALRDENQQNWMDYVLITAEKPLTMDSPSCEPF